MQQHIPPIVGIFPQVQRQQSQNGAEIMASILQLVEIYWQPSPLFNALMQHRLLFYKMGFMEKPFHFQRLVMIKGRVQCFGKERGNRICFGLQILPGLVE